MQNAGVLTCASTFINSRCHLDRIPSLDCDGTRCSRRERSSRDRVDHAVDFASGFLEYCNSSAEYSFARELFVAKIKESCDFSLASFGEEAQGRPRAPKSMPIAFFHCAFPHYQSAPFHAIRHSETEITSFRTHTLQPQLVFPRSG
jgi:hypothetical protein